MNHAFTLRSCYRDDNIRCVSLYGAMPEIARLEWKSDETLYDLMLRGKLESDSAGLWEFQQRIDTLHHYEAEQTVGGERQELVP